MTLAICLTAAASLLVLGLAVILRGVRGLGRTATRSDVDDYFRSASRVIKDTDWDAELRALCEGLDAATGDVATVLDDMGAPPEKDEEQ